MDGKSADDRLVHAAVEGEDVVIRALDGSLIERWSIRDLRMDAMHEGGVVHVESPSTPGALLAIDDAAFVSTLRAKGGTHRGLLLGRRGLVIGVSSLAVLAGLMAAVYLNVAAISSAVARRIPSSVERDLAPRMGAMFMPNTCRSEKANAAMNQIRDRLDPEHRIEADIHIVNVRIANAFALPGGVVMVTRDLLEEADSPDEVAGVLAHELAHVEHRDALSHMIRNALLGGLWAATLGDYSGLMVVDPKTAYEAATLKFSREAEAAADDEGLRMLTERSISTHGLVRFLERNGKDDPKSMNFLSTHPASEDRIAKLSRQRLSGPPRPVLDSDTFYELRKACETVHEARSLRELFH